VKALLRTDQTVIDLVGFAPTAGSAAEYHGVCW